MLDAGLRAVTAMTDSLMTGNNDTAYDIVLDYIRAISKLEMQLVVPIFCLSRYQDHRTALGISERRRTS